LAGKNAKMLKARVTHLEMEARPARSYPVPSRPRTAVLNAENMPLHFYRYLYEQVGKSHHWYLRRVMGDDGIAEIIHSENTNIDVLYADGSPAGFFELDLSALPKTVEIAYFGLIPDFQGLGLGKWFLNCAIQKAWDLSPEKVIIHTNTLDHPAALSLYQKMGFSPVGISEEEVTVWE
jgi:GNAT superfamily N-acetyltransferase